MHQNSWNLSLSQCQLCYHYATGTINWDSEPFCAPLHNQFKKTFGDVKRGINKSTTYKQINHHIIPLTAFTNLLISELIHSHISTYSMRCVVSEGPIYTLSYYKFIERWHILIGQAAVRLGMTYLPRLMTPRGIPVGVLNAGSSFSPSSRTFCLNTWETQETETSCHIHAPLTSVFCSVDISLARVIFLQFIPIWRV